MFVSRLLKTASPTFTEEELQGVLDAYYENGDDRHGHHGPHVDLAVIKEYLESKGVVFDDGAQGDIWEQSKNISHLKKFIIGFMIEDQMEVYGTDTPLPEFEGGEGMFIYTKLEVIRQFEDEFWSSDDMGKPEVDITGLDDEEILQRHQMKKDRKW